MKPTSSFLFRWLFLPAILLLGGPVADAQTAPVNDSAPPQEPLTSADTVFAHSFDTAVTPWFHPPYWAASADSFTTGEGMLQPVREPETKLWIAGVLLIALLIVGFVRVAFQRYVRSLFGAVFSMKLTEQLYDEQDQMLPFSAFALNINFLLTIGLLIFLILQQLPILPEPKGIRGYAVVLGIVSGLYFLRYLSMKALYFLFPHLEEVNFYNFHFFLLHKVAGIVMIPFLFLLTFSGEPIATIAIYGIVVIALFLLLLNYTRGFVISKQYWQNDVFHFFLYICTLEIAPSIVIYKSFYSLFL